MSWDGDRVRIELCRVMSISPETLELASLHGAEIWLSDEDGKILRTRKPAAILTDESRPGLLRQIAGWMESRDDPSLSLLASEIDAARSGSPAGGEAV